MVRPPLTVWGVRIIAIMLGRLRLTLNQAESAYLQLSAKIFTRKRSWWNPLGIGADFLLANGQFNTNGLEEAIKWVITDVAGIPDSELLKDLNGQCKV
jgi:hypothetical protein